MQAVILRIAIAVLFFVSMLPAHAATAPFTYQGRLLSSSVPASGSFDFRFKLYDAATSGNQVGSNVLKSSVAVSNGLFSVELDFGDTSFPGAVRWLQIELKKAGTTTYTLLSPRQKLTQTPYAITAATLSGKQASDFMPATGGSITGPLSVVGGLGSVAIAAEGSGIIKSTAESIITVNPLKAISEDLCVTIGINDFAALKLTSKYGDTSTHSVRIPVDVPIQVFGSAQKIKRMSVPYKTGNTGAKITRVALSSTMGGSQTTYMQDLTTHNSGLSWDTINVALATPQKLQGGISVLLVVSFGGSGGYGIEVGPITLVTVE